MLNTDIDFPVRPLRPALGPAFIFFIVSMSLNLYLDMISRCSCIYFQYIYRILKYIIMLMRD